MEEENLMKRSDHGVAVMMKEKKFDSSGDEEEAAGRRDEVSTKVREKRPYPEKDNMKPSSPGKKDLSSSKQISVKIDTQRFSTGPGSMASSSNGKEQIKDDQLESAKAEMGEVREENQRLKKYLNQIMMDYENLKMQFRDIVQQDAKKPAATTNNDHHQEVVEEQKLVSLTLGRFSSDPKMDDNKNKTSSQGKEDDEERGKEGLSLGLDYKFEGSKSDLDNDDLPNPSPTNSTQEPKEEKTWPPSEVLKTMRSGDEAVQPNPVKKTRVCVRGRCDAPTMNDGCQWRKYGQKISKGNSCPRAYYRCTVAPSCPVRKQVQRFADDMSILITTYEGNHNHPLPISATAMSSATSAAASMLLSGPSLSASQPGSSSNVQSTANIMHANLHGLNFYLSDNNSKSKFYLPNSTSLSAASSHPTITLDLTSTPSSSLSFPFNRFSSVYSTTTARYPSASLNFGSSESNAMPWRNGLLNYGSSTQSFMKNQIGGMENSIYYQSFMQKNNLNLPHQHHLPDTIVAATKAITADPNFQSALATALTSIIGNAGNNGGASATDPFPVTSGYSQTMKENNCLSTFFLNKSPSTNSQPGSLIFLPPSLPFSTPKNTASTSPDDTRSHSN